MPLRQFYTTPPNISFVGILLGWPFKTPKLLGWIPTVFIPNPDHPPLRICLIYQLFCTKKESSASLQMWNNPNFHFLDAPASLVLGFVSRSQKIQVTIFVRYCHPMILNKNWVRIWYCQKLLGTLPQANVLSTAFDHIVLLCCCPAICGSVWPNALMKISH